MANDTQSKYDVFISYSSKDKKWADAACAVLEKHKIRCWIAPRDITPGTEWGASIISGIDGSKIMVLIFSTHASQSAQVRREVERAIAKGLIVLPSALKMSARKAPWSTLLATRTGSTASRRR
jgi:TIR domain